MIKNIVQEWTWIVNNISTNHNPRLILKFFIESINVKRFFICYTTRNENNNILALKKKYSAYANLVIWSVRGMSLKIYKHWPMAFEDLLQTFSVEDHFCLDRLFRWGSWMKECAFGISQKWPTRHWESYPARFKKMKLFGNFPVYKYFRRLWPHEWVFSPLLELFLGSIP